MLHLDSKQTISLHVFCLPSCTLPHLSKTVPWDTHFPLCPSPLSTQTAGDIRGKAGAQGICVCLASLSLAASLPCPLCPSTAKSSPHTPRSSKAASGLPATCHSIWLSEVSQGACPVSTLFQARLCPPKPRGLG